MKDILNISRAFHNIQIQKFMDSMRMQLSQRIKTLPMLPLQVFSLLNHPLEEDQAVVRTK